MARKRARDWPIIVYSYGVLPRGVRKLEEDEFLRREARAMNDLWNEIVEIGRSHLQRYDELLAQDEALKPLRERMEELKRRVEELGEEKKRLRVKLRTRKHPDLDRLEERRKKFLRELKEVRKEYREKKKEVKGKYRDLFREMHALVDRKVKEAPLYWGNKESVRDRFLNAWSRLRVTGRPPRFHRFDGDWLFTKRFSGGIPVSEAQEKFLDKVPPEEAYDLPTRKRAKACCVHITYDLGKDHRFEIPIIMHRPLPPRGFVKRILLVRKEHGKDWAKWFVNFVVEVPPEEVRVPVPEERKPLAVLEIGFRKVGEEKVLLKALSIENGRIRRVRVPREADVIRIGVLYDGKSFREIYLPAKIVAKFMVASDKQSKADRLLQECKNRIRERLLEEDVFLRLPKELQKLLRNNEMWGRVRKRRLKRLIKELEDLGGDFLTKLVEDIKTTLAEWDRLMNIVSRIRKKAAGARRKYYEKLAIELFDEFERIIIPKIDLKRLSKKEQAEKLPGKARFQRFQAALYELRTCLEKRAWRTGSRLEVVEVPYKTRVCHACGTVNEPSEEKRKKQFWVCEGCGKRWDQDKNAALNLWKLSVGDAEKRTEGRQKR